MIICKNKRKGILSPYSQLRTAFGRQQPPHFSSGKHSHQPHLTSFSRAHLETDNWSAEFYILFIFFLSNQTKWFPLRRQLSNPRGGQPCSPAHPATLSSRGHPAEMPALGHRWLVCGHLSPTSQSANLGLGRTGRDRIHFPRCGHRRWKVTIYHKVTSAQWRDEWFGVLNSLVFPKCLI